MPPEPPKSSFWNTLGLIGVAVGVGAFAAYSLDYHSHACARCGHKWSHLGAYNAGDHEAHTCKGCGDIQWWKNIGGDGAFRVSRDALPAASEGPERSTETSKNWGEMRRSRRIRSEER